MATPEKIIRRESLVLRVLWMLLFLLVWQIAVPLLGILVVAQLLYRLFYAAPSVHFMNFGDSLSQYLAQIGRFAVFHTDEKPWPMADWPQARAADGEAAHTPKAEVVVTEAVVPVAPVTATETVPETELVAETPAVQEVQEVDNIQEALAAAESAATAEDQQPDEPKL